MSAAGDGDDLDTLGGETDDGCENTASSTDTSAAHLLIGEVVQSRRRPLLGPSPG